jgi:hypothetical protein
LLKLGAAVRHRTTQMLGGVASVFEPAERPPTEKPPEKIALGSTTGPKPDQLPIAERKPDDKPPIAERTKPDDKPAVIASKPAEPPRE